MRKPELITHSKNWLQTVEQTLLRHEGETDVLVVNAGVRPTGCKCGVHDQAHANGFKFIVFPCGNKGLDIHLRCAVRAETFDIMSRQYSV